MRFFTRSCLPAVALGALVAAVPAAAQTVDDQPYNGIYIGGSFGGASQSSDGGQRIEFDRNLDGVFGDTVTLANPAGANAFAPGFCGGRARGGSVESGCVQNAEDFGIEYYARVGMDTTIGNGFVVGVVGEFGKPQISDYNSGFSTTPASYTFKRSIDYNASIRGRAGYATPGATLFYGTFGASYARIDNEFFTTNTLNSFTPNDDKDNAWGFSAGGGVEQRIGRFGFGLEYLFTQYANDDYRVSVGRGSAGATNPFVLAPNTTGTDLRRSDEKFGWHSLRVTANYRF